MVKVPIKIKNIKKNLEYIMEFKVGFVGCDQNYRNEFFPVHGWLAYKNKNSCEILLNNLFNLKNNY